MGSGSIRDSRSRDELWLPLGIVIGALAIGALLTISLQATAAFVIVLLVIALYQHDRRWGMVALFSLWFLAPMLRRILGSAAGFVENDPLSLAPFLATAAVAAIELGRVHVPTHIRRILLVAAMGFAVGLPLGLLGGPRAAVYGFIAYIAGLSGAALGLSERPSLADSNLRRILLFGIPPIAIYAIVQRTIQVPSWDLEWLQSIDFVSIGDPDIGPVRAFGSLNGPGALAPLLGLSLLCYLSLKRARTIAIISAAVVAVALSLTFVRSAWVSLIVAGIAHVIASNGRSARVVFTAAAVIVATTVALAPVSPTAHNVLDRFTSISGGDKQDTSTDERQATVSETLPKALVAPLGHGLGTAGEPSRLSGELDLRAPDNGYLSLLYQVGPIGFLLVMAAIAFIVQAAWRGARSEGPGQDLRLLLFAMLVFLLVQLYAGDSFYGSHGVIFWFIGGQVLAYDFRLRRAAMASAYASSSRSTTRAQL
jgi:hypothetical protein